MSVGESSPVMGAALWSYAGAFADRIVRFAVFLLIARYVAPADFGTLAIAMLLVELLQGLLDAGLAQALVRPAEVEDPVWSTAFWASIALGLALSLALLLFAGLLADLLGVAHVRTILAALAPVPLLQSAGLIHLARLQRVLGFRQIAARTVSASLLSGAIAVVLVLAGYGIWALVARTLILAAVSTAMLWITARWVPRLHFRWAELAPLLPESVRLVASNIVYQVNMRGLDLAAGLVLGVTALASLRVAGQTVILLVELTLGPLAAVAFAALARQREDMAAVATTFALLSRTAALVMYPAFFGLAATAPELLHAMFGAQWHGAAMLLPLLAAIVVPLHFQTMLTAALFAAGRSGKILQWQVIKAVAIVVAGLIGAQFGLYGIAAAATLHLYLLLPIGAVWLRRDGGIDPRIVVRTTAPALIASAAMAAIVLVARQLLTPMFPGPALLPALLAIGVASYAAALPLIARDLLREGWARAQLRLRGLSRPASQ